jgi:WD40 repeat protein
MRKQIQIEKVSTLQGHRDSVYRVEQGDEPSTLFSAGGDGFVVRWDLRKPKDGHLMCQVSNSVYALRYVPELERLVVAQNHQGLHVIDPKSKKEERSLFLAETAFFDIRYDQDRLYVGAGDGSLFVIQVSEWKIIQRIRLSASRLRAIQITEHYVITGSSDHSIRILDKESLAVVKVLQGHYNSIFSIASHSAHPYFFSTGRDAHIRKWKLEEPFEE